MLWTLLTSQFIHAGWTHLLGNLIYLWVFGRAVEARLGPLLYLALYLAWGVGAALVQIVVGGPSDAPLVGASGAIAGVLGAYLVLFPSAWVSLLVPVFLFFWVFDVPAILVLGFWFVTQLLSGAAAITRASQVTANVAFWAHAGGFGLGAATAILVPGLRRTMPALRHPARPRHRAPLGLSAPLAAVADAVAFLLVVRVVVVFAVSNPHSPVLPLAQAIVGLTAPLVEPFLSILPIIQVVGRTLELYTVAAALAFWLAGALLAWLIEQATTPRQTERSGVQEG